MSDAAIDLLERAAAELRRQGREDAASRVREVLDDLGAVRPEERVSGRSRRLLEVIQQRDARGRTTTRQEAIAELLRRGIRPDGGSVYSERSLSAWAAKLHDAGLIRAGRGRPWVLVGGRCDR